MVWRQSVEVEVGEGGAGGEDAGVEDEHVEAAEAGDGLVDGGIDRVLVGDVGLDAEPRRCVGRLEGVGDGGVGVHPHDRRPFGQEGGGGGPADAAGGAGDEGDLAGEGRRRRAAAELGLLQVPVLHVEQVGRGDGPVAAEGGGVGDHLHGVAVDVLHDGRVPGRAAGADHPQLGVEDHPGGGVEGLEGVRRPGPVLVEVAAVGGDEAVDVAAHEGDGLGADDVVGRDRSPLGDVGQVGPGDEGHGLAVGVARRHEGRPGRLRHLPAELGPGGAHAGDGEGGGRRDHVAVDVGVGPADEVDHGLVRLPGGVAPGEDAVVHEDDADDARPGQRVGEDAGALPGQEEAGHHVGHDHDLVAVDAAEGLGRRLAVGEGDDGVGVGVVDEPVREDGVEDRLHRRRRPARGEGGHQQLLGHVGVGEGVELGQAGHLVEAEAGEARTRRCRPGRRRCPSPGGRRPPRRRRWCAGTSPTCSRRRGGRGRGRARAGGTCRRAGRGRLGIPRPRRRPTNC